MLSEAVVLLANDPLHTPCMRQRAGLMEHKKGGITPHRDHWNGGSGGGEKAMDYMRIPGKRTQIRIGEQEVTSQHRGNVICV